MEEKEQEFVSFLCDIGDSDLVDRVSDELVLAERVAGLAGARVHRALVDLLF